MRAKVSSLVEECSTLPAKADLSSASEPQHVVNVQIALHELGHDVSLSVATVLWRHYYQSRSTDWAAGAETCGAARPATTTNARCAR